MKACEALIEWTPSAASRPSRVTPHPTAGQVRVRRLPYYPTPAVDAEFLYSGGAAYVARRTMRGDAAVKMVFVDFHTLVVRDGIDPAVAHEAFLAIDEYALTIAPDIPGARDAD